MKVLITGANGLLGPYLSLVFGVWHTVAAPSRQEYELTKRAEVKDMLAECQPNVIIHAAAETNIDVCEEQPIRALADNREATSHLVELLSPSAKFVYLSTDMVYSDIPGPHREDEAGPVNMYGRSKFAGEKAAAINPHHLILRTNFFGPSKTPGRQSFSDWAIESLKNGHTEVFYNDVWWSPLHMETLSQLILSLVEQKVCGTYNIGSREGMTKADFVVRLAAHKGLPINGCAIGPSHYKVKRPKDLRLDCTKLAEKGWIMPKLEEEIARL